MIDRRPDTLFAQVLVREFATTEDEEVQAATIAQTAFDASMEHLNTLENEE